MKEREEKCESDGSITVEAALLYPFLMLITLLLVLATVCLYDGIRKQASEFYEVTVKQREWETSQRIRLIDTGIELVDS